MVDDYTDYCLTILDSAKRFLEKADKLDSGSEKSAFIRASIQSTFSFVEATLHNIVLGLASQKDFFSAAELGVIEERRVNLNRGVFVLTNTRQFHALEDRILLLLCKFNGNPNESWVSKFSYAISVRNRITHPRGTTEPTVSDCEQCIESAMDALNALFLAVHNKPHPKHGRGLQSESDW